MALIILNIIVPSDGVGAAAMFYAMSSTVYASKNACINEEAT